MELSRPQRPRVSRETRLLLSTVLLSVFALWVLARVRFPDQPPATTPLQPILTQLGARPTLDDLASELADLRQRLEVLFVGAALRIRSDIGVMPLDAFDGVWRSDPGSSPGSDAVIAADPVSRLAVVRAPPSTAPPPEPWRPDDLQRPRYLIAVRPSAGGLALQPVLTGPLIATPTPLWREPLWRLPAGAGIAAGSFVFTTDARLAGLVVDIAGASAIIPASVLLQEVDRLLTSGARTRGYIGVDVQPLTPPVAYATGANTGVIVAWVDSEGPAAQSITIGDAIEAVDEQPVATPQQWAIHTARVPAGHTLMVRVRRGDDVRTVGLIAAPQHRAAGTNALGLVLRNLPGTGSMVVEVRTGSAADRAGLRAGDVITRAAMTMTPSPAAVRRAFDRAATDAAVLIAYTRAGTHGVTALEKR
jgi:S1-C subfamily serine protease